MSYNFRMLEDCVLIDPMIGNGDKTQGGIVLPEKLKKRPIIGTVIAVGPGVKMDDGTRYPMMLKPGDIVVFPQKSGDAIFLDGQDFIVVPERYILMAINDEVEDEIEGIDNE